jgi:hypothetical protein
MKNAALFALGLLSVNFWLHDSARCQTSLAPPLSRQVTTKDAPSPNPAADYDGFTPGIGNEHVPRSPLRPRTANQTKPKHEPDSIAPRQSDDPWQPDEQIRRKITICRGCQ